MKTFDHYFVKSVAWAISIALIFLLGIDFLVQSSEEFDNIGTGNYSILLMFYVMLLRIPEKIIELLPAAILLGTLMSIGQMNTQNELIVLRCSGVSRLRIAASGIILTLLLGLGLIAIGEYWAPTFSQKSEFIRNQALIHSTKSTFQQGIWFIDTDGSIVNIGKLNSDGSIGNVRFFTRKEETVLIKQSPRAVFSSDGWMLSDEKTISLNPLYGRSMTQPFRLWKSNATPDLLFSLADTASATTIRELSTLIQFLSANSISHANESLRLWQRIFLPFSTLTMLLVALLFAFSHQRTHSTGTRFVIGIFLGVGYYILQGILSNVALLFHWPPLLGALLPIALLALPTLWLLLKN